MTVSTSRVQAARTALRGRAGRVRRTAWEAAQRLDPSRLALESSPTLGAVAVVSVYRARNAQLLRGALSSLPDAEVRLWSLDGCVPTDLADATVGTGPGMRFPLLNRLIADLPQEVRRDGLILLDDDVHFVVGHLSALLAAGRRMSLDVYQPAQTARSHGSWPITYRERLTFARVTDYVEQGPVVVLSAAGQSALLPLPEDMGMAWGVEARWWRASLEHRLRQGVVDAVALRHLVPPGRHYDRAEQDVVLARELAKVGLTDIRQLQRVHERMSAWEAWRSRAPHG